MRVVMGFLFQPGTPQFVHSRDRVLDHQINLENLTDDALTYSPGEYAPHLHRKSTATPAIPIFAPLYARFCRACAATPRSASPGSTSGRTRTKSPVESLPLMFCCEEHNQRYQDAMNERVGLPRAEFERYPTDFHWGAVTTGRVEVQTLDTDHLLMCTTHPKELGLAMDDFFRRLEAADDVANWVRGRLRRMLGSGSKPSVVLKVKKASCVAARPEKSVSNPVLHPKS